MKNIHLLWLLAPFLLAACGGSKNKQLPILGQKDIMEKEVNGQVSLDTVYHTIPEFKFVDQDSNFVTAKTFEGKIYVADFFFTTCPTICPIMKTQMMRVYDRFKDHPEVLFLSHSIDPMHDTVAVLKDFSDRLGIDSQKWHFVTGDKKKIYDIGQNSYMVTAQEDENEPGGYIHSGAFILVDKQRRIRGFYDGTKSDQVDLLMRDIEILLQEYQS